jgi:hypothetical protein
MVELKSTPTEFRSEVLELLCYLMTAARGVIYEPRLYAPYRLAEGARRLIMLLDHAGVAEPEWLEIASRIEHNVMRAISDEEACKQILDEIVIQLAGQLKEA